MIHKEGYPTLAYTALTALILNLGFIYFLPGLEIFIAFLSLVMFCFFLNFFRNPGRNTVLNEKHVLSPADGKVVVIEETTETEYFKDKRIQVSVFMSPMNVHVNRNPIGGVVKYFKYHPGKYLVAWHPKSSTENERTTMVIQQKNSYTILMRQIAGFLARRIVWYPKEGDTLKQGEEMGFIKFGSRVDMLLPLNSKIKVSLDQVVRGGETVIAEISDSHENGKLNSGSPLEGEVKKKVEPVMN